MQFRNIESFQQWREQARRLLADGIAPQQVHWTSETEQPSLFDSDDHDVTPSAAATVPQKFLDLARQVACHRDAGRWELLYRTVWRLTHGEPHLLKVSTDDDVLVLMRMQHAVTRDVHKMKAFVRFRKVIVGGEENFVAWHRPDHRIVRLAAPFFSRRFKAMNWSILTPDESVRWDQSELHYGAGVPVSAAPDEDALEELWKTYYASIFNPARVKVAMMKREMPVRHWATLPEAQLIPELLQQAPGRVDRMTANSEGFAETAAHYMPAEVNLSSLAAAAKSCRACDLCDRATQVVFGEGPVDAGIVLIGEQPGDREDIEGRPFVGPSGQLLDQALAAAGIDRRDVYVTNTVKHFKYTQRGERRLHKKPDSREIFACRPWLEAELSVIKPAAVVCLGATPAQALFGRDFRISQSRGQIIATDWCPNTIATWHPAAVLRMPDTARRQQMLAQLSDDLRSVAGCSQ